MSSIDDLYNQVARDYGRKSYRTADEDSFREFMKKKTFFMFDAGYKAPFSEFEKPYLEDDYTEMEQMLQNPPGLPWNWPDFPPGEWDNPSWPPGQQDLPPGGDGFIVFWCSLSGCFCPGETRQATLNCSHQITGVSLASPTARISGEFSVSAKPGGTSAQVLITADKDAGGAVEIDVDMISEGGVRGSHDSIMIGSCSDCDLCDEESVAVAWDSENNPETADAGDTVQIFVTDGVAPFAWEVTSCGDPAKIGRCVMVAPITTSRTNFVKLSASACGTVNIKVTDACETECEGQFRILTNSGWRTCDEKISIQGGGCSCSCSHTYYSFGWTDRCNDSACLDQNINNYMCATYGAMRMASVCGGGCCGTGCAPDSCMIGPKTCSWAPDVPIACYDPCGNGCHIRTSDHLHAQIWTCCVIG